MKMKKLPKFQRLNYKSIKRVGSSWRKPRGIDNKQRMQWKSAGAIVRVGYRSPKDVRGLHPSGKKEVIVNTVADINKLTADHCARIAGTVGQKKREAIRKQAALLKIKVLN